MEYWFWMVVVGVCGGIISASLGVGGGILFVPAMVLLLGFDQKVAQGTSLAALVVTAAVGAVLYRQRLGIPIDLRLAAVLGAGGVAGALIGAVIVAHVSSANLRRAFAVFMMLAALRMFFTRPSQAVGAPAAPVVDRGANAP